MTGPAQAEISTVELSERLARGEPFVVLDVREPFEREFCTIPVPTTALDLHVPMASVPSQVESLRSAAAGRPTVVYCHHGVRSASVVQWLTTQGLRAVLNLRGGIDAWSLTVGPDVPRYR